MSRPPSRPLTLLALWAARNVFLAPFSQIRCAEASPAPQVVNLLGGDARWFQWRTYPLTFDLEGSILDDF